MVNGKATHEAPQNLSFYSGCGGYMCPGHRRIRLSWVCVYSMLLNHPRSFSWGEKPCTVRWWMCLCRAGGFVLPVVPSQSCQLLLQPRPLPPRAVCCQHEGWNGERNNNWNKYLLPKATTFLNNSAPQAHKSTSKCLCRCTYKRSI